MPHGALTLSEALALTSDARVVTTNTPPYAVVHVNKAWSEQTGFLFTEVMGKSCSFLQGPATDPSTIKHLRDAVRKRTFVQTKLVNYTREGAPFWCEIEVGPVAEGSHFYATITATAIEDGSVDPLEFQTEPPKSPSPTSWKGRGANKPAKRGDKYRLADCLANTTDPLVLCAKEHPHPIIHPNQPWLEMCGYTLEEVEGLTNHILTGPETDPSAIAELLGCVEREEPVCVNLINYKRGGHKFANQLNCVPVYDENDELAAFMSMLHEVDDLGPDPLWEPLAHVHKRGVDGASSSRGAAAPHSHAARYEAAGALIANHVRVLDDLLQKSGQPPSPATQPHLTRVESSCALQVDIFLREVARLLLGTPSGAAGSQPAEPSSDKESEKAADPARPAVCWSEAAAYLIGRINDACVPLGLGGSPSGSPKSDKSDKSSKSNSSSKSGALTRRRDMSAPAAVAMRAVLRELAASVSAARPQ